MKTRSPMKKLAATMVAASALVGCSVGAPSTIKAPDMAPAFDLSAPAVQGIDEATSARMKAMHEHMTADHMKKMAEFLQKLNLSETQKTELKNAIKKAFERNKSLRAEVKPLVIGEKVDRMALKSVLDEVMKKDAIEDAQTLEDVRTILTWKQRMMIVEKLQAKTSHEDDEHTKLFRKLIDKAGQEISLNEAQKESFRQLKSSVLDYWKQNRMEYYTAMATYLQSGNKGALKTQLENLNAKFPSEAAANFMASLDQAQREKLVHWKETLMEKIESKFTE